MSNSLRYQIRREPWFCVEDRMESLVTGQAEFLPETRIKGPLSELRLWAIVILTIYPMSARIKEAEQR